MKRLIYFLLGLFLTAAASSNLYAINVSTGVTNAGLSVGNSNMDPNWIISAGPNGPGNTFMVPYVTWAWQAAPVSGTNAGWINSNGSQYSQYGVYTLERPFTVSGATSVLFTNFGVAWDDQLFSLELVPPVGPAIPLSVPSAPMYQIGAMINQTVNYPMAGIWKIRAVVNHIDYLGGFILSGDLYLFESSSPCGCENLTVDFTSSTESCSGNFAASASVPGCMAQIGEDWYVNNVLVGSGPNLSYTFPGDGTYNVCVKVSAIKQDGRICQTAMCHNVVVTNCTPPCSCEQLLADFNFKPEKCDANFRAKTPPFCFTNVSYEWYSNNVHLGSGQNLNYDFPGNGNYTVCLKVKATMPNGQVCETESCQDVAITDCDKKCDCENIVADFTYTGTCYATLTGGALIPNCVDNVSYEWFVDGNPVGTGQVLNYMFPTLGSFNVCMRLVYTLQDGQECEKIICRAVHIDECPPCDCSLLEPEFNWSTDQCYAHLTAGGIVPQCLTNVTYEWFIGTAYIGSGAVFDYAFPGDGSYQVCLKITGNMPDGKKCSMQICHDVDIQNCPESGMKIGRATATDRMDESIVLYPNPASSELNITFSMEAAGDITVVLRSLDGKLLLQETQPSEAGAQRLQLQLPASIANGVVLVEITTGERTIIRKVSVLKN